MNLISKILLKHNLILKASMAFSVAMLLTLLLPQQNVEFHNVDEFDAVWPYNDLILEEELFQKKSEEQLKSEKNEIFNKAPLVFVINEKDKIGKLEQLEKLKYSKGEIYKELKPLIDSVYNIGIIQAMDDSASKQILVEENYIAQQGVYSNYFTVSSAMQFISGKLKMPASEIIDYLAITVYFDKHRTEVYRNSLTQRISVYQTYIPKGEVLVRKGEQLTKKKRELINLYFQLTKKQQVTSFTSLIGRFGIMLILALTLLMYLAFFRKNIFGQNKQVAFLFLCLSAAFVFSFFFYKYGLMLNSLPYLLVPIMVRVFFDSRTALFTFMICVLACSFFMADKMEFILMQLISGIGILFSVSEMRKRQQIINAAVFAVLYYFILFACYQYGFGTVKLVTKLSAYLPFLISGSLLLLATPLIFVTEKLFGFVSDFKLMELCDVNHPLLRDLSQQIPGTFQHSLQVANLAEEAIYFIGGNTLLVRAGAMYHDVGKIYNPKYFIENQGGNINPHIEMQPRESAKIIIEHVIKGVELAKKHELPEQIIDFIRTHHGTTTVGFFLSLQKKELGETFVNEDDFRYPGPIPFSKETAVLMLADGVEAASRSLKKHDALSISDLVDNIIDYKIKQNQLINADITFKDITVIKKIFKKRLMNIYHARIEYPT